MMEKIKIAFQGEMGAYSHIACEEIFPGSSIRACPTFEETFKIAYDDENYKIVIPIENSLRGSLRVSLRNSLRNVLSNSL